MAYTTIDKPTDYFNTKLYTGNGSTQSITGVGFQPDWTWIKPRSVSYGHSLHDSVRGASKRLISNNSGAEDTFNAFESFDSDGFSLSVDGGVAINDNTETFVSWNWLAGGTASSNTDGSITSTVSANTTAGFSIVKWTSSTGADTVGHGLGVTPQVVISKTRSVSNNWSVHTTVFDGSNDYLFLNLANGSGNSSYAVPTSSIFNYNYGSITDHISYVFAEKKGYSKFGSYTGNGNSDGTFVYLGFKPAVIIAKLSSGTSDWRIYDNKRLGYNVDNNPLRINDSRAEETDDNIDFLSNGFKWRTTDGALNGSGSTYFYMAFASSPFVTSTGIPTTAR